MSSIKVGPSTKMLLTLYKALIQSVLRYAVPALLLASKSTIRKLEGLQTMVLRFILGLPHHSSYILLFQEAEVFPLGLLVRKDTTNYIIRAAMRPDPVSNTDNIQAELLKLPRVFHTCSWPRKAALLQKEMGIPTLHPPNLNYPLRGKISPCEYSPATRSTNDNSQRPLQKQPWTGSGS